MTYKLLLVDDDAANLAANKRLLVAAGYQVSLANSGDEARKTIKNARKDFALVLMDYHMPGMTGAEAVAEIKKIRPDQQIVAFSMDDTREVTLETFRAGVVDFLDKNSDNEILLSTIAGYCEKFDQNFRTLDRDDLDPNETSKFIAETGMIGRSDKLFELAKQIRKVGPTQATTLILGESGTGKELVAKALHQASERAKGPFVAVNIAAESASLLDSSLFGHRKGAFTGAVQDQPGKFQLASKGTIFLDEIGDMNLDLQVKLLRVLQEREVLPLGATRPIAVDVRIVAATHKNLQKMVEAGTFREDLYYRLSSVILSTTPLRERPDDIEPLLVHFTDQICKENGFTRAFHRRCLEVLREYHWKGNVRELRSVVESHLIASESGMVRVEDLDARLYQKYQSDLPATLEEFDDHLDGLKRQFVMDVLKNTPSRAEAARKLDVAPNRLHYFISKWRLGAG